MEGITQGIREEGSPRRVTIQPPAASSSIVQRGQAQKNGAGTDPSKKEESKTRKEICLHCRVRFRCLSWGWLIWGLDDSAVCAHSRVVLLNWVFVCSCGCRLCVCMCVGACACVYVYDCVMYVCVGACALVHVRVCMCMTVLCMCVCVHVCV